MPTAEEVAHLHRINVARSDPPAWCLPLLPRDGMPLPGCEPEVDWDMYRDEVSVIEPAPPVAFDPLLLEAARGHARYLAHHRLVGHFQKEGRELFTGIDPGDRLKAVGWSGKGAAENAGGPSAHHEGLLTGFIVDWERPGKPSSGGMQDPRGHRDALFAPKWDTVGPAVVRRNDERRANLWVVHEFATSPHPRWLSVLAWEDGNGNGLYDPGEGFSNCRLRLFDADEVMVLDLPLWDTGLLSLPMADTIALRGVVEQRNDEGEWKALASFEAEEGAAALWWEANMPPLTKVNKLHELLTLAEQKPVDDIGYCLELMLASWGMDVQRGIGSLVAKELSSRPEATAKATVSFLSVDAQLAEGKWMEPFPEVFFAVPEESEAAAFGKVAADIAKAGLAIEPVVLAARARRPIPVTTIEWARKAEADLAPLADHPALGRHARRLRDLMSMIGN